MQPLDYQAHVDLIQALRSLSEVDALRLARQSMHKVFPLTQGISTPVSDVDLWLEWVQDEVSLASTPQEYKNIIHLYSQAVNDYLSKKVF